METINRICWSTTSSPHVFEYDVSHPLTIPEYELRLSPSAVERLRSIVGMEVCSEARETLAKILELDGVRSILVRPGELHITLFKAYRLPDVHEGILAILASELFRGTNVDVSNDGPIVVAAAHQSLIALNGMIVQALSHSLVIAKPGSTIIVEKDACILVDGLNVKIFDRSVDRRGITTATWFTAACH